MIRIVLILIWRFNILEREWTKEKLHALASIKRWIFIAVMHDLVFHCICPNIWLLNIADGRFEHYGWQFPQYFLFIFYRARSWINMSYVQHLIELIKIAIYQSFFFGLVLKMKLFSRSNNWMVKIAHILFWLFCFHARGQMSHIWEQ